MWTYKTCLKVKKKCGLIAVGVDILSTCLTDPLKGCEI